MYFSYKDLHMIYLAKIWNWCRRLAESKTTSFI